MSKSILDQKKILAVDDEPDILAVLKEELESHCSDCTFDTAANYDEAVKSLESKDYDLVILDIMGVRGFHLLEVAVKKNLRAVMLTANALSSENLKRSYDMGARAYLPKQKLGEIVPFLEDALKYEFEPGWKRLLGALGEVFTVLLGRDWAKWEKLTGTKSSDWGS